MPVEHYENFPVASFLLPKHLHEPVTAIYWFARTADDYADEGSDPPETRLSNLRHLSDELDRIGNDLVPDTPLMQRLAASIRQHRLPLQPFHDLLSAFSQDVSKTRYANYEELVDYCRRSADPIGRLLLHLYDRVTPQHLRWSDSICTSLQLINHWQDIAVDWRKNRVYLPQDDLARFGVTESAIAEGRVDAAWRALFAFELDRARSLLDSGRALPKALGGRIGLELAAIVAGGSRMVAKLAKSGGDIFRHRPTLSRGDAPRLALATLSCFLRGN